MFEDTNVKDRPGGSVGIEIGCLSEKGPTRRIGMIGSFLKKVYEFPFKEFPLWSMNRPGLIETTLLDRSKSPDPSIPDSTKLSVLPGVRLFSAFVIANV
jgi:hypothetical protein